MGCAHDDITRERGKDRPGKLHSIYYNLDFKTVILDESPFHRNNSMRKECVGKEKVESRHCK